MFRFVAVWVERGVFALAVLVGCPVRRGGRVCAFRLGLCVFCVGTRLLLLHVTGLSPLLSRFCLLQVLQGWPKARVRASEKGAKPARGIASTRADVLALGGRRRLG